MRRSSLLPITVEQQTEIPSEEEMFPFILFFSSCIPRQFCLTTPD
jgi:hypothetical protein